MQMHGSSVHVDDAKHRTTSSTAGKYRRPNRHTGTAGSQALFAGLIISHKPDTNYVGALDPPAEAPAAAANPSATGMAPLARSLWVIPSHPT